MTELGTNTFGYFPSFVASNCNELLPSVTLVPHSQFCCCPGQRMQVVTLLYSKAAHARVREQRLAKE